MEITGQGLKAKSCINDSGPLAALLDPREERHVWARETISRQPRPWLACDAVLSETFFLLHPPHALALDQLLRRGHLRLTFSLVDKLRSILDLRAKHADVPMRLADACLVRMTETPPDSVLVTADTDFKIYRRQSRLVVPCLMP